MATELTKTKREDLKPNDRVRVVFKAEGRVVNGGDLRRPFIQLDDGGTLPVDPIGEDEKAKEQWAYYVIRCSECGH